jgi:hypothetical protein
MSEQELNIVKKHMVEVLNRAIEADRKAVEGLMSLRVECNQDLADDPTIQVAEENGSFTVSPLGLFAGIAGIYPTGFARIHAVYEVDCPDHGHVDGRVNGTCPVDECDQVLVLGELVSFA